MKRRVPMVLSRREKTLLDDYLPRLGSGAVVKTRWGIRVNIDEGGLRVEG